MIRNAEDVARVVNRMGILPFFRNDVEDFSLEEITPREYWFPDSGEGVWEWKSDIMLHAGCAYGKFYRSKACFVSIDIFPDLVNYRRSLRRPSPFEQQLLDELRFKGSLLSSELKKRLGYTPTRKRRVANPLERMAEEPPAPRDKSRPSFEATVTRLQMDCRIMTADFEYRYNRIGERTGWGVARYCIPEEYFGYEAIVTGRTPEESHKILVKELSSRLPQATPEQIERIVGTK